MFFSNINYIAVLVSAIAAIGLGFIWYSPYAFSKMWLKEMGYSLADMEEMKKKESNTKMAKTYSVVFVFSVITSFVLAALLNSLIITSISGLVLIGFLLWLAFTVPLAANSVLFGKDSFILFSINSGFQLASTILMTLILGIFG
jgi:hypothetical protein